MQQVDLKVIFLTCILLLVGCIGTETDSEPTKPDDPVINTTLIKNIF